MELASWDSADPDEAALLRLAALSPRNSELSRKLSDVFVIFKISPKFNLCTRLFLENFTHYGDGWSDVSP